MSTAMPAHPGASGERWGGGHPGYPAPRVWGCSAAGDRDRPLWLSGCHFGVLWAEGAVHRGQLPGPRASAMPCHTVPWGGSAAPRCRGAGARLPFPLAGAVKEALCARPLPWPVRTSGNRHERAFQEGLHPPAPGNRSQGGTAHGRAHNVPLCWAPGRPPWPSAPVPTRGCSQAGGRGVLWWELGPLGGQG